MTLWALAQDTIAAIVVSSFIGTTPPTASAHASTIVETPSGMVAAWFGGTREGANDVGIWLSRREAGVWTEPKEVVTGSQPDGGRLPCYNPVLFRHVDGTLHLFYKVGTQPALWWGMHSTSRDDGRTWTAPARLADGMLGPVKNKPVILRDGTIIAGSSTETTESPPRWRVHFEISRDGARTWKRVSPPAASGGAEIDAIQPSILMHANGALQAIGRTRSQKLFQTWSRDRGETWTPLELLSVPNPNAGTDAVTLRDGRHLLVYNNSTNARTPLVVALSSDGARWRDMLVLESGPGEYSYPAIVQAGDGRVHITYTWQRKRIRHVVIDLARLTPDASEVWRTWDAYVVSRKGYFYDFADTPSPHWLASEQRQWKMYDLASLYLQDGATRDLTSLMLDASRGDTAFRITTRLRLEAAPTAPKTWWSAMTTTVYAVRDGPEWRLANALPRHTRGWKRDVVGPITYVYAAHYPYNRARAQRAVTFTDSLAHALGVPRLSPLTYYLTRTVDEVYAIMGLESDLKFGATGGVTQPVNHQLFSGIPALGEEYRHELAHLILAPLVTDRTSYFMSEGVPTWLGGTAGKSYQAATRSLGAFLAARPAVTLDSLIAGGYAMSEMYPAGAVFTEMAFERGGTQAVKDLFTGGGTLAELRVSAERVFGEPWSRVSAAWRERVTRTVRER